jgi:hypothetical protein
MRREATTARDLDHGDVADRKRWTFAADQRVNRRPEPGPFGTGLRPARDPAGAGMAAKGKIRNSPFLIFPMCTMGRERVIEELLASLRWLMDVIGISWLWLEVSMMIG